MEALAVILVLGFLTLKAQATQEIERREERHQAEMERIEEMQYRQTEEYRLTQLLRRGEIDADYYHYAMEEEKKRTG